MHVALPCSLIAAAIALPACRTATVSHGSVEVPPSAARREVQGAQELPGQETSAPAYRSTNFAIHTTMDLPLPELAEIAETARKDIRSWLGVRVDRPNPTPVAIYLFETAQEVYDLEAAHGLRYSVDPRRKAFSIAGGFFPEQNFIAFELAPHRDIRNLIAHEVVHSAIDEVAPYCPTVFDEGLATLYGDRVEARLEGSPFKDSARNPWMESACRKTFRHRRMPSMRKLFQLGFFEFRDAQQVHFSLAWCLTKVLLESEDPRILGRLPAFVRSFREPGDVWRRLNATFPVGTVEALWHAELARLVEAHYAEFPSSLVTAHFRILSDKSIDLKPYAWALEETRSKTLAWLSAQHRPNCRDPRVDVYICHDQDKVDELSQLMDYPVRPWLRRFSGWRRKASEPLAPIVITASPERRTDWDLSREVCHLLLEELSPGLALPLKEGLSEVIPYWVLDSRTERLAQSSARYPFMERACVEARTEGSLPALSRFFHIGRTEFGVEDSTDVALAWSLVRMLAESDDPRIAGRLATVVRASQRRSVGWKRFASAYDLELVDSMWRASLAAIERPAPPPATPPAKER